MSSVINLNLYLELSHTLKHKMSNDEMKKSFWLELYNNSCSVEKIERNIGIAMILIHPEFKFINPIKRTGFIKRIAEKCELGKLVHGAICPNNAKEKDHIWPFSLGGETIDSNRADLCEYCNRGKSNTIVGYFDWGSSTPDWVIEKVDFIRRSIGQ